jgi:hypothetical protein
MRTDKMLRASEGTTTVIATNTAEVTRPFRRKVPKGQSVAAQPGLQALPQAISAEAVNAALAEINIKLDAIIATKLAPLPDKALSQDDGFKPPISAREFCKKYARNGRPIHVVTFMRWVREGKLAARKIAGHWMVAHQAEQDWFESLQTGGKK